MIRSIAKKLTAVVGLSACFGCTAEQADGEEAGFLSEAITLQVPPGAANETVTSPRCGKKTVISPSATAYLVDFTGANGQTVRVKPTYPESLPTTQFACENAGAQVYVWQYVTPPGSLPYWTTVGLSPGGTGWVAYVGRWQNGACSWQPNPVSGGVLSFNANDGSPYVSKYRVSAVAMLGATKKRVGIEAKNALVCID
jgi:hypothetical protein